MNRESRMEHALFPEPPQMSAALLQFIFFLRDVIEEQQWHFEQLLEQCHPADVRVLLLWMEPHGPLMVKDIARELGDVNLSTLTRILDRLEKADYIQRILNPQDRRSFQVQPTEQGQRTVKTFVRDWQEIAQGILAVLTPTEQLIFLELLKKIQHHWPPARKSSVHPQ